MKLSGLAILLFALLLAGVAAFFANQLLDDQQQRLENREKAVSAEIEALEAELEQMRLEAAKEPEPETVPMLVATRDLSIGTKIDEDALGVRNVSPVERPGDAFSKPDQVLGDFVIEDIAEGDPILPTRLTKDTAPPFAAHISSNMRSITIDIDDASGQLKLIERGNLVDVLIISGSASDAVILQRLQNIKVLAIGQKFNESRVDDITGDAPSVTLEVTREQAELLARAIVVDNNKIRLLLRKQEQQDSEEEQVLTAGLPWSESISDRYRAITIDLDEASGQLKLIESGSRVDVVVTPLKNHRLLILGQQSVSGGPTQSGMNTETLPYGVSGDAEFEMFLENIKVLAVGQNLDPDQVTWSSENQSVTLEIPNHRAAEFARAVSVDDNKVRLLLRNKDDPHPVNNPKRLILIRGTEQCITTAGRPCS